MKFSLSLILTTLLSATAVVAAPAELVERNRLVHCPTSQNVHAGSQTYTTHCAAIALPNLLSVVQPAGFAKNFGACLKECSALSDAGTCCQVASYSRILKTCTLYGAPGPLPITFLPFVRDRVGIATQNSCH